MQGLRAGALSAAVVAVIYLCCLALPMAVLNVFGSELFPPEVRTVNIGVPIALAIGVFGGTFPALAETLADNGRIT